MTYNHLTCTGQNIRNTWHYSVYQVKTELHSLCANLFTFLLGLLYMFIQSCCIFIYYALVSGIIFQRLALELVPVISSLVFTLQTQK